MSRAEAEAMIMAARLQSGLITAEDIAPADEADPDAEDTAEAVEPVAEEVQEASQ